MGWPEGCLAGHEAHSVPSRCDLRFTTLGIRWFSVVSENASRFTPKTTYQAVADSGPVRPVALVTGASSGIGRALAVELASRGHDLVVTARREHLLEQLAIEVRQRRGVTVEVLPADLRDHDGLARVVERATGVDVLVANAGISTRGAFADLPSELEVGQVELNVLATVALCRAAAAHMRQAGHGRILITSSVASFQPIPFLATYGASKAFLTAFSQAIDAELRPAGVTVTCLAPGFTVTELAGPVGGPRLLWLDPEEVARTGVDGLLAGRRLVVPGMVWRPVAALGPRLPRAVTLRVARYVGRRMVDWSGPDA